MFKMYQTIIIEKAGKQIISFKNVNNKYQP